MKNIEESREVILAGELKHFQGFMDQWISENPYEWPAVHGPAVEGTSLVWLVVNGYNMVLDFLERSDSGEMSTGDGFRTIKLRAGMSFNDFYLTAKNQQFDMLRVLKAAQIRTTELPDQRTRVIFSPGHIKTPHFWKWVDEQMEDLQRLGFLPVSDALEEDVKKVVAENRDKQKGHGGHPGLPHNELIYRLAKAQQAIEIRQDDPQKTWKEIAIEIEWRYGFGKAGVKLLEDARLSRLKRMENGQYGDPQEILAEISEFRRKEKKKTK